MSDTDPSPSDYLAGALALLGGAAFAVGRRRRESVATDAGRPVLDDADADLELTRDDDGVFRL